MAESITAAANNYDVSAASIRKTCNGKHKSAAQKVWRWKGEAFLKYQVPDVPKLYPGEYFRPIKGTNAEVSNYGRVRNMDKCGILYKLHNDCYIQIRINGSLTTKRVYVLEAETMLPNPNGYKRVGFLDGDCLLLDRTVLCLLG